MPQLAAVMRLQAAAGRRLLLIAATPESSMAHAEVLADLIPDFARIDLTIDTTAIDAEDVAAQILGEMRARKLTT